MVRSDCNSRGYSRSEGESGFFCKGKNCNKLDVFDWTEDLPEPSFKSDIVESDLKIQGKHSLIMSTIFTLPR